MHIYIGTEQGDGLVCPPTPAETLIVQDGALVFDSGKTVVFNELGRHGDHVEWGGMLSVDETGSYRKMYNSSVQGTLCESESNKAKIKAKHWLRIIVSLCASL